MANTLQLSATCGAERVVAAAPSLHACPRLIPSLDALPCPCCRQHGGGVPEYWGRDSPYHGGTEFLGTPTNHLDVRAAAVVGLAAGAAGRPLYVHAAAMGAAEAAYSRSGGSVQQQGQHAAVVGWVGEAADRGQPAGGGAPVQPRVGHSACLACSAASPTSAPYPRRRHAAAAGCQAPGVPARV